MTCGDNLMRLQLRYLRQLHVLLSDANIKQSAAHNEIVRFAKGLVANLFARLDPAPPVLPASALPPSASRQLASEEALVTGDDSQGEAAPNGFGKEPASLPEDVAGKRLADALRMDLEGTASPETTRKLSAELAEGSGEATHQQGGSSRPLEGRHLLSTAVKLIWAAFNISIIILLASLCLQTCHSAIRHQEVHQNCGPVQKRWTLY
jgi:hypothetical protein